jgi:hypothetical protein
VAVPIGATLNPALEALAMIERQVIETIRQLSMLPKAAADLGLTLAKTRQVTHEFDPDRLTDTERRTPNARNARRKSGGTVRLLEKLGMLAAQIDSQKLDATVTDSERKLLDAGPGAIVINLGWALEDGSTTLVCNPGETVAEKNVGAVEKQS